jgi:hypothetical protein
VQFSVFHILKRFRRKFEKVKAQLYSPLQALSGEGTCLWNSPHRHKQKEGRACASSSTVHFLSAGQEREKAFLLSLTAREQQISFLSKWLEGCSEA